MSSLLDERVVVPLEPTAAPVVDVVVPVHNEAHVLARSVERLHDYLTRRFPLTWRITIADNASTDGTWPVAERLAERLRGVRALHLDRKGRGLALRTAWLASDARVLAYMDVDLSTDLDALLPLVAPLVSGHSDLAIGSRLAPGARVVRGTKRELISRTYNLILRTALRTRFRDAQCGFKAVRREVALALLPVVEDDGWFFDTELLVAAQRSGLRIHEVPVDWVDDPDSRVDVWRTAVDDLKGVWRVARHRRVAGDGVARPPLPDGLGHQAVRFAAVGVLCTVLHLGGYVLLRDWLGPWWANATALTATTVLNVVANRRITFGRRGPHLRRRQLGESLAVYVAGLAVTSAALAAVRAVGDPSPAVDVVVLFGAGTFATVLRFVLLRGWVYHPRRDLAAVAP